MSQTAITPKSGLTITGTAGTVFSVAGRDAKQIITWRQPSATNTSPLAAVVLTQQSQPSSSGKWGSTTRFNAPVMETLADGSSDGYVAAPKVADRTTFELRTTRSPLASDADVLKQLEQFLAMCLQDVPLRTGILGYAPADA